jgi:hypothetical protein
MSHGSLGNAVLPRRQSRVCVRYCDFVQYLSLQEITMRSIELRYHYQPTADRVPRWIRRVWAWF